MRLLAAIREMIPRRAQLVGINRRNVELVYPHNRRRDFPEADDKLLAKELFVAAGVPTPVTIAVCDGLYSVVPAVNALAEREQFVVKPASGSGGQGIVVVQERTAPGIWRRAGGRTIDAAELKHHMAEVVFGAFSKTLEDRCIVEERVVPHEVFSGLWQDGLCDVRVITLRGAPVFSMVRVPTHESQGRANLHQGGLGLALDLDTGRTVHAVHRGAAIERHPESGALLLGLQMPDWPGLLDVAARAARALHLGYLGVDVVVDRVQGPLVLEVNARPGLEIQNVHGRGLAPELRRAPP